MPSRVTRTSHFPAGSHPVAAFTTRAGQRNAIGTLFALTNGIPFAEAAIMKIAVTSQNRATVTGHAGQCRKFWIYETEYAEVVNKRLVELAAGQGFHDAPPPPLDDINVLISGGMASAMRYRLKQRSIQAVTTLESDPDRAVAAWLNGTLDEMPPFGHIGQLCDRLCD